MIVVVIMFDCVVVMLMVDGDNDGIHRINITTTPSNIITTIMVMPVVVMVMMMVMMMVVLMVILVVARKSLL